MFLRDKNGSPISHFAQWDKQQYVYFFNWEYSSIPRLHCYNKKMPVSAPIEASRVDDTTIRAMIPNELLLIALPIDISVYLIDADGSETTVFRDRIPVRAKAKPTEGAYDWDDVIDESSDHQCIIVDDVQPSTTPVLWFDTGTAI